ncbi:MAG TPA: hypothetical protein VJR30_00245 [Bradyrhizobium sp.]|nr:hypothetical protein [Bradyrhizobium sp.]
MLYSKSPPLAENDTAQDDQHRFSHDHEERDEPRFGRRPMSASIHALPPPRPRPSLGRRIFRRTSRFAIVVLIGVGATLGWQAYGNTAKQMLATSVPELAGLVSYIPAPKPPVAAAAPANPALQLEPLAANLEFVRRSVEQIALKQEQMIRNITALQITDEEIRQKVSSPPPAAPAQPAAVAPPPKPAPQKLQPPPGAPAPRPSANAAPVSLAPR